ncbi:MAG TPA: ATP-binding protein [Candidatus Sulfotelmatobacter sp.]|nr:ATP-binding protein [Candidatus Sulfotelmatobacter sp.]
MADVVLNRDEIDPEDNEELFYAPAVQILSEDLYPRKLEIVREYIQNASDALDDWMKISEFIPTDRSEPQIRVSIQGKSLLIFDNGIGMAEEDIPKLKRVAYSEKKIGEEAGYKGIGRLAGIAVADKLKITTTTYGDPKLHYFEFRAAEMRQYISEQKRQGKNEPASPVIQRHTRTWWKDIDPAEHCTLVEIHNIKDSCDELLDPDVLMEYIGDIGPVDFAPDFEHGSLISDNLRIMVPDYSPKPIYLARDGKQVRVYKPFTKEMKVAPPEFIDIRDPDNAAEVLAYCWYTSNADEFLGKMRATGKIFSVAGEKVAERRRFAGLVYKLFGFSIGDRYLPERTLWTTARARAPWFTGEIHIVDKNVQPTTSRSDFIENAARTKLYTQAQRISLVLNSKAQTISDNRNVFTDAERIRKKLEGVKTQLDNKQIDRSDIKVIKAELEKSFRKLRKRDSTDKEIGNFQKEVRRLAESIKDDLNDPKKLKQGKSVSDLVKDLDMSTKARKVFQIVMEALQQHYSEDKDEYHVVADKIHKALKDKYD